MAETPDRVLPVALGATSSPVYTAGGAGTWAIVRAILLTCTDGTPVNVTVGFGTSSTDTAARRILDRVTVNPGEPFDWSGFLVVKGGATPDLLYAFADRTGAANITISMVTGP